MRRSGITLLEVILALAIFVGSLAVISKLVEIATRGARYAQLQTRAVLLAESKMGELVAGIEPLGSGSGGSFTNDPAWRWELAISDGPVVGVKWVHLTVAPSAAGELANERMEYTLSRWMLDPSAPLASATGAAP
jgi:general secretion pathway protein I